MQIVIITIKWVELRSDEPMVTFVNIYEKNLFSCLVTITKSFLMKTRYPGRLGIVEFTRIGLFGLVC